MKQFTFYKLYSDILDGMNDTDAGKFAMRICEYEFEDKLPEEKLNDKERFYWNSIADMLAEVKEVESSGRSLKRYNLRSDEVSALPLTYEQFRSSHPDLQGDLFGSAERYKTALDWADVTAKLKAETDLQNECDIYRLIKRYEQKYGQKG